MGGTRTGTSTTTAETKEKNNNNDDDKMVMEQILIVLELLGTTTRMTMVGRTKLNKRSVVTMMLILEIAAVTVAVVVQIRKEI